MRLLITAEPLLLPGWSHLSPPAASNGLPDYDEPVERIFVADVLEDYDPELLPLILHSWHAHPQVSVRTLLAATGRRDAGRAAYTALRSAGWGVALPYNKRLLVLDGWPVRTTEETHYGALCRAIKQEDKS